MFLGGVLYTCDVHGFSMLHVCACVLSVCLHNLNACRLKPKPLCPQAQSSWRCLGIPLQSAPQSPPLSPCIVSGSSTLDRAPKAGGGSGGGGHSGL